MEETLRGAKEKESRGGVAAGIAGKEELRHMTTHPAHGFRRDKARIKGAC